jgi:hypothetical protein
MLKTLLTLSFVASGVAIIVALGLQLWIPALQLRRFSRIFAGRPAAAAEAFQRVFDIFGWRARLACRLFRIPIPAAVQDNVGRRP